MCFLICVTWFGGAHIRAGRFQDFQEKLQTTTTSDYYFRLLLQTTKLQTTLQTGHPCLLQVVLIPAEIPGYTNVLHCAAGDIFYNV